MGFYSLESWLREDFQGFLAVGDRHNMENLLRLTVKKILLLVVFLFNFTYNNITYAYDVSVGGSTYSVSRIEGTYSDNISLLQSQIWWGNTSLAHTFAQATGGNFGYQYFPGSPSNYSLL